MHYFDSLLQKEIMIHHNSNIKTTLNYINHQRENVRSDQRRLGFRVGHCQVQLTGVQRATN